MRRYLILVNNIQQAENIVGLFDDGYVKRKHYTTDYDYVIIKNDESVVYDILLSGKNHYYYRGRSRWNGVIRCCIVSHNELNNNIYPYIIEEYYDDEKNLHLLPSVDLVCNNDEMFLNAIKLIENYNSNKKGKIMEENRLDKTISDVAYILDNLMLLRQIQQTGNCNNCKNENCGHIPRAGQMVRYNCPFYEKH